MKTFSWISTGGLLGIVSPVPNGSLGPEANTDNLPQMAELKPLPGRTSIIIPCCHLLMYQKKWDSFCEFGALIISLCHQKIGGVLHLIHNTWLQNEFPKGTLRP